ncbi:hypothetical protein CROQUDRAFT_660055 [Cronartium quercuum f. sp. fusiforme G11]|uniref:Flavin reductase like domain-containing protein n=1 Tax=Cronartium quercuum f. sp. fusiforme G11 TaxID=708437 RepID=A0A9P6NF03_9BASI|nr:hypothetical protein CROQUDRAFT_660055 [Cronartium quercuum f. sp. fusiforme G11]
MTHHPPFKQVENSRPAFETKNTFQYTKTPQPDWAPGQGVNDADLKHAELYREPTASGTKTFVPYENISVPDAYKLMINSVVPRPIALCSTLSVDGHPNLAPFSYFNAVGHNPPVIMVSFTAAGGKQKDSGDNIKKTKEFVVNIISEPFIEAANYTAIDAPPGVSEWALSGLTQLASTKVKPARCQEAAISMECELEHLYETFDPSEPSKLTQTVVLGRIKAWHIKESVLVDGGPSISIEKLMPIARLGGISYTRVNTAFELTRPVWEKEKELPEVKALLEAEKGK